MNCKISGRASPHFWEEGLATISIFLLFPFCNKSLICLGINYWSPVGQTFFSSVPHRNSVISVSDPWRAFWADTTPFKGPRLASYVDSGITEIQGPRQLCFARRGGPGHCQELLTQALIVRLFKAPSSTPILDFEKSTECNWVSGHSWFSPLDSLLCSRIQGPFPTLLPWVPRRHLRRGFLVLRGIFLVRIRRRGRFIWRGQRGRDQGGVGITAT